MKSKPANKIDKLLGELGMPPHALDPEEFSPELDPYPSALRSPITGLCGKTCYNSESTARKCANLIKKRGANTSFLRPYFCQTCKAWHITSNKGHIAGHSTVPKRNAGHNRRNHHQIPHDYEP